ncbi:unnamed protein product [Pleuronectes platessa]|uniref:Uncharacterized protein n=1 Tax=Pleuronectes platessa TaxID=8262 RepID=A0A9N7VWC7_PLEPL|nr:unnamed protein product [Pleuronectes platessa]
MKELEETKKVAARPESRHMLHSNPLDYLVHLEELSSSRWWGATQETSGQDTTLKKVTKQGLVFIVHNVHRLVPIIFELKPYNSVHNSVWQSSDPGVAGGEARHTVS